MLTLDEAQARLIGAIEPLPEELVGLERAGGRYLANAAQALRTQPPFAASAMDGYAIRFNDMPGPWEVVGESAAGARFQGSISAGQAVRIFTGAPMPEGADTVIVQEDIEPSDNRIALDGDGPPRLGAHVRSAGLDFADGDLLAAQGTRLTPARIGLLAAGGHGEVAVHRRPRVALLATGDELVPAGVTPGPDQIVSANGPMLAALFASEGAEVVDLGIAPDSATAIGQAIDRASGCDLLVTIGGASVGDHDLVLPVLESRGARIDFWKVAIKPGKPMLTGMLGEIRVIGLPGNPVSAFVCAQLFALPALRRMAGCPTPLPRALSARAAVALEPNGARRDHLRATLAWKNDHWVVTPAARQDSSMLRTLADSNALLVRPENAPAVEAGTFVPVLALDSLLATA